MTPSARNESAADSTPAAFTLSEGSYLCRRSEMKTKSLAARRHFLDANQGELE
jgi:hypothetical protein